MTKSTPTYGPSIISSALPVLLRCEMLKTAILKQAVTAARSDLLKAITLEPAEEPQIVYSKPTTARGDQ